MGVGDDDFCKESHTRKQQKMTKNDFVFLIVLSNFSLFVKKKMWLCKKRRKVKQKNNWVRIKDKKKKARQLESDSYNEPIKQGKDKHCADQAESLLDNKKRNATRRNGIEQRQGHRDSQKTARLQTN